MNIDNEFLDQAEKEIYNILLQQHHSYTDRWYSSTFFIKTMPILRYAGVIGSLIGTGLSLFIFWKAPAWCPAWINIEYYALTFFVLLIFFYFIPVVHVHIKNWNKSYAYRNCKKIAGKCVKDARIQAPYIAHYKFSDNEVTYFRIKDDESKFAWKRKLKGVAFHGKYATVFFRKWTSFIPKIIILHENYDSLASVLDELSINVKPMIKNE